MKRLACLAGLVLLVLAAAPAARAQQDPWAACGRAIAAAERGSGLPQGMLLAIATVESGRRNPETRQVQPWPWTWNAAGESGFAETRGEAAGAINALLAGGTRSIDIGCMQVNLLHHQDAFAHVEEGLDPTANVAYAIRFLRQIHARTGSWAQAIAEYHSATPWRGAAYHQRVVSAGRGTGLEGGAVALPYGVAAGLCSPGLTAALLTTPQGGRAPRATATAGRREAAPAVAQRTRIICMGPRIELAAALPLPPVSVPIPRGGMRPTASRGGDPALLPLPPVSARPSPARATAPQPRPAPPGARGPAGYGYPSFFVPAPSYFAPPRSGYAYR